MDTKKFGRNLAVVVLATSLMAPTISYAQPWGKGMGAGPAGGGPFNKRILEQLNLSEEQQQQLREIRKQLPKEERQALKGLKDEMHKQRSALHEALQGNASDQDLTAIHEKLVNARKKMHEAQANLGLERFKHVLAIRKILTQEQRKKFMELRSEWQGRRGMGRQGRGRRGGNGDGMGRGPGVEPDEF